MAKEKTQQQKRQIGDGINKRIIDKGRALNEKRNQAKSKVRTKVYA